MRIKEAIAKLSKIAKVVSVAAYFIAIAAFAVVVAFVINSCYKVKPFNWGCKSIRP